MFSDVRKLQEFYNDIKFGFQTISDNPAVDGNKVPPFLYLEICMGENCANSKKVLKDLVMGLQGATWNYGASSTNDFGGGTANAVHSGGVGMFGSYGHVDTGENLLCVMGCTSSFPPAAAHITLSAELIVRAGYTSDYTTGTYNDRIPLCAGTHGSVCSG